MSYDILFQQALSLHEAGQLAAAEQIYRQILETAPEQPDVLNLLGLVAQAKGVQSEACGLFYRALKAAPDRAPYYFNLAFSFKLDNKPLEALENFQKALSLDPGIAAAYDEIALIYEQLGQIDKARENWKKALETDKSLISARANLARSRRHESKALAIEELEQAASACPDAAVVWYYLSQLYLETNQDAKAWNAAGRAKELAPASDEARVVLGQLALREKQTEKAKIYFEKAVLLNPQNIAALLGLADVLSRQDDPAAEEKYKRVLELDPKNFNAHANYADLLYRQKRLAEALEEYRAAVILNPRSAEVSNNLAVILRDQQEYDQALGLLFNALALNPGLEEISVNLLETLTLYAAENREEALKIAEKWFKNTPENVFAEHALKALRGEEVADNKIFSAKYFEHFADNYELVVKNLGYSAPLAMGELAGTVVGSVVDLGCGTGLVGEIIKSPQNHLTGVDLAQKMLDASARKGIYDRLVKADAVEFLQQHPEFDWIFAADVAGYLGNLEPMIAAAKGKRLVFSVEKWCGAEDYKLSVSGRYQHKAEYVENLLTKYGFRDIVKKETVLRQENGQAVKGIIFYGK